MNAYTSARTPYIFIIDYKMQQCCVLRWDEVDASECLYQLEGVTNCSEETANTLGGEMTYCSKEITNSLEETAEDTACQWEPDFMSFADYEACFDVVMRGLRRGDSFLTNLTVATPVRTDKDLKSLFLLAKARYKMWVKDCFAFFSPEIFVKVEGDVVASYPMKGTIDASIPNAYNVILNDEKEKAEHATIVDLIRNDLSMIASEVNVARYRYADLIHTNRGDLLQISSEVTGKLPHDWQQQWGNLFFKLLPAGSICGAPKPRTLEIIDEAETSPRGFYTGVAGYYDGNVFNSAVMIRFVEQTAAGLVFKSGGGITFQSDARSEYEEIKQKTYIPGAKQ